MIPERWEQINRLYYAALEVETKERARFLEESCLGDSGLHAEVEALLAMHEKAGEFLDSPAIEAVAQHVSEEPPSLVGRQLGPYQILGLLGVGGMGEVYKAKDTRLNRNVAIKVIPKHLAERKDLRQRFEREAKAIAGLNHPHICALYDIGSHEGVDFLVMEHLEGERLSERLKKGPLPLKQLLQVAMEITSALEQAHKHRVTHRDLKPGNIMLTEAGAKLLDFGLAKSQPVNETPSRSGPAIESESLTDSGTILETVEYMAPEQVEGKEADSRTDIFALGAVIYEMGTGKRAFEGKSQASLMAAILTSEPPPMTRLQPLTPRSLEHAVKRCLAKDPDQRWQSAHDLGSELKWIAEGHLQQKLSRRWRWAMVVGLGLSVVIALGTMWWMRRPHVPSYTFTPHRITWDTGLTTDPALSSDGKFLAYASDRSGEGNLDIWVQPLTRGEARGEPLRLTHDPADDSEPAFSPDGNSIAFRSMRNGGGIYLLPATGGAERLLIRQGRRPRFSPDGRWIAYWVGNIVWDSKSFILPLSGGPARLLQPDFSIVAFPTWSPDGKHILYDGRKQLEKKEGLDWWVTPAEGGTAKKSGIQELPGFMQGVGLTLLEWTSQQTLVFSRRGQDNSDIWQISISPETFQVTGSPQRLTSGTARQIQPSVASGYLAFSSVTEGGNIWALPVDHSRGKALGEIRALTHDDSINALPSISADGERLVYTSRRSGSRTGLIKELDSGRIRPLLPESPERSDLYLPKVTKDGSMVAYSVHLQNKATVYVANTDDLTPRLLCEDCGDPGDWFPDGHKLLLYLLPSGGNRIDSIDVDTGKRSPAIQYSSDLIEPQVSPDGHWITLNTNVSAVRVSIMAFPLHNGMAASEKEWVMITDGSGFDMSANWSPDGKLLYFYSERDGFLCIWGQKLDPTSKSPLGPAFAVYHSHDPRRSIRNVWLDHLCMSVSRNQIVFPMGELTGNIWITEYREQQ